MIGFLPGMGPIALLLLAVLAFFVEKNYTNRWTVVVNCVIILTAFGWTIIQITPSTPSPINKLSHTYSQASRQMHVVES